SWSAVARLWGPYLSEPYEPASPFPLRRVLERGGAVLSLIGLSSAIPSAPFMAYGRLGAEQSRRLDALLAGARGLRCVLLHHPPLPAMTHWRKGLLDAAELERVLRERGAE